MKMIPKLALTLAALVAFPLLLNCLWEDEGGTAGSTNAIRYSAVSSGWLHTCALTDDGAALCWGMGTTRNISERPGVHLGQANPPPKERFIAISSGSYHTCGLREDGKAICWGAQGNEVNEEKGQANPPPDERFVAISSGDLHTCGIRKDGQAVCWGDNELGESTPPEGELFRVIASGAYHTCGLKMDSTALCWGQQPGTHDISFRWQETPPWEFFALDAAGSYTCGLHLDGVPQCWGYVSDVASHGDRPKISFEGRRNILRAISAGDREGCGLRDDGRAVCWGANRDQYSPDYQFSDISVGGGHHCGILNDSGGLICWGRDDYGQASPPGGERIDSLPPKAGEQK